MRPCYTSMQESRHSFEEGRESMLDSWRENRVEELAMERKATDDDAMRALEEMQNYVKSLADTWNNTSKDRLWNLFDRAMKLTFDRKEYEQAQAERDEK